VLPKLLRFDGKAHEKPVFAELAEKKNIQVHGKPGAFKDAKGLILKKPAKVNVATIFYLAVSILSLGLLTILTFNRTVPKTDFTWQKPATGLIFSAICVLGIIAGLSPRQCSRATHFKTTKESLPTTQKLFNGEEASVTFKGHHPTCGNFSSHVLSFGGRTLCAGCAGLVFGAILSLAGSTLYFFYGLPNVEFSEIVFWLGFFAVVCGLLQYEVPVNNSFLHFFLNATFVLGAFFLFVEVNIANESFMLNLYLLSLTVYWILTRIELSRIEHRKKCFSCSSKPCNFSFVN
jgi:hypothetical protein